ERFPLSLHDALPICVDIRVALAAGIRRVDRRSVSQVVEIPSRVLLRPPPPMRRIEPQPVLLEKPAKASADVQHPFQGVGHGNARSEEHTSELQSRVE